MNVRKWSIPLTVIGLGGLGLMLFSERGRKLIRSAANKAGAAPGQLAAWNDSAQQELNHIRQAVKELEHSLRTYPAR
jgi:hypothetical protein